MNAGRRIRRQKRIRITLVVVELFVALGAIAGGIGLLTGVIPASPGSLQGSPFVDYTIPAWSLMGIVGGSMLLAAATILTRREMGVLVSACAGLIMMIFEMVEGAGVDQSGGRWLVSTLVLQSFYCALGLAIVVLSSSLWLTRYRSRHFSTRHTW